MLVIIVDCQIIVDSRIKMLVIIIDRQIIVNLSNIDDCNPTKLPGITTKK